LLLQSSKIVYFFIGRRIFPTFVFKLSSLDTGDPHSVKLAITSMCGQSGW